MPDVSSTSSRWSAISLLLFLFLALPACSTNWVVVRAADPNPLVAENEFRLRPLEYVDLAVDGKPEATFVAGLTPEQVASWEEDKAAIGANFEREFAEAAADGAIRVGPTGRFTIEPTVDHIETGYYRIPAWNAVSRIHLRVKILDAQGEVVDEITLTPGIAFDVFNPASGSRLRGAANLMGAWAGDYLLTRVGDDE